MDDSERDELLGRLDERTEQMISGINELKNYVIAVDRKAQTSAKEISWIKGIGSGIAALYPMVYGFIEWFKR